MNIDDIVTWFLLFTRIINHPKNYPGKHLQSQPRIQSCYKPLQPKSQVKSILLDDDYSQYNRIVYKRKDVLRGFGSFAFEIKSDKIKPAQLSNFDITKQLSQQRMPCFIPDPKLKNILSRYPGKQEIQVPKSQCSVYQKSFKTIYCNPVPIAYAKQRSFTSYFPKLLVQQAFAAFCKAVYDLTQLGMSLQIDFKFVKVSIVDRNVSYYYTVNFINKLNDTSFQLKVIIVYQMRQSDKQTSEHWNQTYLEKWHKSNLSTLLKRPDQTLQKQNYQKSLALKIMTLDLNTTENITYSQLNKP